MQHITRSSYSNIGRAALLAAGLMFGVAHNAMAAGTLSGATISNLATLNYSVGGTAQTAIGSSPTGNTVGAGTATTFVVDNKVNLTVAAVGGSLTTTGVVPGSAGRITTFTVTNTGNTVQDYVLAVNSAVPNGQILFGGTDTFDVTGCTRFVESGTTVGYQVPEDTATFIDELAADASKTVYVLCSVPIAQINGDVSLVSLLATTYNGGTPAVQGALTAQDLGPDVPGTVQVVFADANAADPQGDNSVASNGQHSARNGYRVTTSVLSVVKTAVLLCDPFNGVTNPKNIPGAITRWTITISNTGTAAATLATISDALSATLAQDANLVVPTNAVTCSSAGGVPESLAGRGFKVTVLPLARALGGSPGGNVSASFFTTASDADGVELVAPNVTATFAVILPVDGGHATTGLLNAGESVSVIFNTTIL